MKGRGQRKDPGGGHALGQGDRRCALHDRAIGDGIGEWHPELERGRAFTGQRERTGEGGIDVGEAGREVGHECPLAALQSGSDRLLDAAQSRR